MAQETIDYAAMLADARAKRAALDAFITSLENAQALGALGQSGTAPSGFAVSSGPAVELPMGALRGKSVSNAIKLYLSACRKNQKAGEIAAGLKEGGVHSTSEHFETIVNNALRNLKKAGVVLQFKDGWGLAELYPAAIRNRLAQQEKGSKPAKKAKASKRKRKPVAKQTATANTPKTASVAGIESVLQADKAKSFTIAQIAAKLGTKTAGLQLTLGKMVKIRKAEKCADGKYRAFSGNVQEMPKAS